MTATTMSAEIADAIAELEQAFPGRVSWTLQPSGDVVVAIAEVQLGAGWTPGIGTLLFTLAYHFPDAPIYPYYLRGSSHGVGGALQQVQWQNELVMQVSLRHTGWDPAIDTALGSVLSTISWLQSS